MALTDAQGWPQLHTRFASKEDLLLTCELASSRAGFSNLGVSATQTAGIVRCSVSSPVEAGRKKKFSCNLVLVVFKKVDGGKEVEVNEVHGERLKASAHGKAHKDLSVSLSLASPDFNIKEGLRIQGFLSLHLLEGCLRSSARKEKHFLKRSLSTNNNKDSAMTISFKCAKGASKCKFSVRVASMEQSEEEEEEELDFVVIKISAKHSCQADASPPSKALQMILDAWPTITLGPQSGAPKPINAPGPSVVAYVDSSSDDEAKEGDLPIDPALRDGEVEVGQLEEEGGKNNLKPQAVQGDILVHSDEAPIGDGDESAPARKKAKLSPSVEVETEEQRKQREKKERKAAKKAAKMVDEGEGA